MSGRTQDRDHPGFVRLARRPLAILAALLLIFAANVAIAFLPLAGFNFAINIALAGVGVVLIGVFFMDLDREEPLNRLFAAMGFAWLAILLMLMFGDYLTRV